VHELGPKGLAEKWEFTRRPEQRAEMWGEDQAGHQMSGPRDA